MAKTFYRLNTIEDLYREPKPCKRRDAAIEAAKSKGDKYVKGLNDITYKYLQSTVASGFATDPLYTYLKSPSVQAASPTITHQTVGGTPEHDGIVAHSPCGCMWKSIKKAKIDKPASYYMKNEFEFTMPTFEYCYEWQQEKWCPEGKAIAEAGATSMYVKEPVQLKFKIYPKYWLDLDDENP